LNVSFDDWDFSILSNTVKKRELEMSFPPEIEAEKTIQVFQKMRKLVNLEKTGFLATVIIVMQ